MEALTPALSRKREREQDVAFYSLSRLRERVGVRAGVRRYSQAITDRSLAKIGMSFHRPLTFLLATVRNCGWYR